jgi:hypothetical protein
MVSCGNTESETRDSDELNGFKTKITYITSAQDDQIYTAVQGFLMAVGIEAGLDTITSPKWTQIALTAGKWKG